MKTLVVARWQEDTAWTTNLPPGWMVQIVLKGIDLPNLGREPTSFLWAIDRMYDDLAPSDLVACVQGNPFDHCPSLLADLAEPVTRYRGLGNWHTTSDANGNPHHSGLAVGSKYESWFGAEFPGIVEFTAGGQFIATGSAIRLRSRDFYRRLFDDLMADPYAAWVLERLWPAVFA